MIRRIACLLLTLAIILTAVPCIAQEEPEKAPFKVLCIGHSYSLNATEYLCRLALSQGVDMTVGVAFCGNCSSTTHLHALENDWVYGESGDVGRGYYKKYTPNTPEGENLHKTLTEMIGDEDWDCIIFQDKVDDAGFFDVFKDDLAALAGKVRTMRGLRRTKFLYHRFWSLEKTEYIPQNGSIDMFSNYDDDQATMDAALQEAGDKAAALIGAQIIPCGDAFTLARESGRYDPTADGISLNKDTSAHASDAGKYLAACVWYEMLTNRIPDKGTAFSPFEGSDDLIGFATDAVKASGGFLLDGEPHHLDLGSAEDKTEKAHRPFPWKVLLYVAAGLVVLALVALIAKKRENAWRRIRRR